MMLYVVVWFIVGYAVELEENFWHFLTYWTEGMMVVYFTFAFEVAFGVYFTFALHDIFSKTERKF